MSAMHHDTSSDLKVVGSKLKDILEVFMPSDAVQNLYLYFLISCFLGNSSVQAFLLHTEVNIVAAKFPSTCELGICSTEKNYCGFCS